MGWVPLPSRDERFGACVAALTLAVCYPVMRGCFVCDGLRWLLRLVEQDPACSLFTAFNRPGVPGLFAATGILLPTYGFTPKPYFALLLALHVVNAWLLYRVLLVATSDALVAMLGASAWATGPTA